MRILPVIALLLLVIPHLYAQDLIDKAKDAFKIGDYSGAAKYYEEAWGTQPGPSRSYTLARAYSLAGEADKALDYLEKACSSNSGKNYRVKASLREPDLAFVRDSDRYWAIIQR